MQLNRLSMSLMSFFVAFLLFSVTPIYASYYQGFSLAQDHGCIYADDDCSMYGEARTKDERTMVGAVINNDADEVEKLLNKGVNPPTGILSCTKHLPSLSVSKLLLNSENNPLNPNSFLQLIMQTYAYDNSDENLLKYELTKLVLEKGADPNSIGYFIGLPSIEIASLMLNNNTHPLDPNKFLDLIFGSFGSACIVGDNLSQPLEELVKLSLVNGGDVTRIRALWLPSIAASRILFKYGMPYDQFINLVKQHDIYPSDKLGKKRSDEVLNLAFDLKIKEREKVEQKEEP